MSVASFCAAAAAAEEAAATFALNTYWVIQRFVSQDIITNLNISCALLKFLNIVLTQAGSHPILFHQTSHPRHCEMNL